MLYIPTDAVQPRGLWWQKKAENGHKDIGEGVVCDVDDCVYQICNIRLYPCGATSKMSIPQRWVGSLNRYNHHGQVPIPGKEMEKHPPPKYYQWNSLFTTIKQLKKTWWDQYITL